MNHDSTFSIIFIRFFFKGFLTKNICVQLITLTFTDNSHTTWNRGKFTFAKESFKGQKCTVCSDLMFPFPPP